ncbi:MAG: VanZ family protein [Pseudomonadota bacterium]
MSLLPQKGWKYWIPSLIWMGVIFLLSSDLFAASMTGSIVGKIVEFFFPSLAAPVIEEIHHAARKLAHVTVFALLSWFYLMGLVMEFAVIPRFSFKQALSAIFLAFLYALTDEGHQALSPTRTAAIADVGWDAVGATLMQIWLAARSRSRGG